NDVLPFADRAVVLRDNKIIARARPMELYKNPKSLYVASLFGEASMISIDVLKTYANTKRKIIVYAHEFRVSPSSGFHVTVEKAYPMGSHYLTESKSDDNETIYFNGDKLYPKGKEVFLNVAIETINQRIQEAASNL
ncbi:MAG TPA: ABC transporter ATP-binding protein, partial [Maribacter sp.]|nr:ABC transporter ATP-binding protein [Maribacter sp.]